MTKNFKFSLLASILFIVHVLFFSTSTGLAKTDEVYSIKIDGSINPATADYLSRSLKTAEKRESKLFLIILNTPGGLLSSMQKMVEALLEAKIPTAVYVSPRGGGAISAGVFITLAADFAIMAPGTTIGAAHPVDGTGDNLKGDMREKLENFAVSHIRAIAEQRGRNAKWAEEAVRESVAVTAKEAAEKKVIDFVAGDLKRLLSKLEGKTVEVKQKKFNLSGLSKTPLNEVPMTFRQKVVNILSDPNIAILLGLGAILGIGMELLHPGGLFPGIVGAICLILSLTSAQVIPIDYGGVILLILAGVLFAFEVSTPAFGLAGIAGILSLVLGAIYFVDTEEIWASEAFKVNTSLIFVLAALTGTLIFSLIYLALKVKKAPVNTGKKGMIGQKATLIKPFEFNQARGISKSKVKLRGEIWNCQMDGDQRDLKVGEELVVLKSEGLTLFLQKNPLL